MDPVLGFEIFVLFTFIRCVLCLGTLTSPPKVRKDTHVSKPKVTPDKANTKDMKKFNVPDEYIKVVHVITPVKISKPLGPKQVWVPKKK